MVQPQPADEQQEQVRVLMNALHASLAGFPFDVTCTALAATVAAHIIVQADAADEHHGMADFMRGRVGELLDSPEFVAWVLASVRSVAPSRMQ